MSDGRPRDKLLDDLVATTRGRDVIHDVADRALEQRDRCAQALRMIRDTCPGVAANIARRALEEAEVPEPEDDDEFGDV